MQITKISLQNFKKITAKDFQVSKKLNTLIGSNGSGKTTIKEAIIFCLYGTDQWGKESSKFIRNGEEACSVEVTLKGEVGEYTIKRIRTGKGTKLYLYDGSTEFDLSNVAQRDLNSQIPTINEFLAVFNVGYFMKLDDKEKREFILALTENIDKFSVYTKLGGTQELYEKYVQGSTDTYKHILNLGKQKKKEVEYKEAQLSLLSPINVPEVTLRDSTGVIVRMEHDLAEEEKLRREYATYAAQKEMYDNQKANNAKIQKELRKFSFDDKIESPSMDKINELKEKKYAIRLVDIPKNSCPSCKRTIGAEYKAAVGRRNDKMRKEIEKIDAYIVEAENDYRNNCLLYNEVQENKRQCELLKARITNIIEPAWIGNVPMKEEEYQEMKSKLAKLREQNYAYQSEMREIENARKHNIDIEEKRNSLQDDIVKLHAELVDLRKLRDIFAPTGIPAEEMRMKLEPIQSKFNKLIPGLEIQTLQALKTTVGMKEVFKIKVDGIVYDKLSTGEKLRTDIAISQVIDDMLAQKIGVYFIDNAESMSDVPSLPDGQVFIASVGKKELAWKS